MIYVVDYNDREVSDVWMFTREVQCTGGLWGFATLPALS